jgi:hypothetical protein
MKRRQRSAIGARLVGRAIIGRRRENRVTRLIMAGAPIMAEMLKQARMLPVAPIPTCMASLVLPASRGHLSAFKRESL